MSLIHILENKYLSYKEQDTKCPLFDLNCTYIYLFDIFYNPFYDARLLT